MRSDIFGGSGARGKYEAEPLATELLDGMESDEEAGDVETIGHYRLYLDVRPAELVDADFQQVTSRKGTFSAILHTGNEGFVTASYFHGAAGRKRALREWDKILDEEAELEEDFEGGEE